MEQEKRINIIYTSQSIYSRYSLGGGRTVLGMRNKPWGNKMGINLGKEGSFRKKLRMALP